MAYPKLLSADDILTTSLHLLEQDASEGLSLRAVAAALHVKAPSLYRYFPNKEALETAVAEHIWTLLLAELQAAATATNPATRFRHTAETYLRFARDRFPLYNFVLQSRLASMYGSKASKAAWNVLLHSASAVSAHPDDTAAAVATWSFLHGFVMLEHTGAFGASGARGGLEVGITALLNGLKRPAHKPTRPQPANLPRRKKP